MTRYIDTNPTFIVSETGACILAQKQMRAHPHVRLDYGSKRTADVRVNILICIFYYPTGY